jgi:hypothetical protein
MPSVVRPLRPNHKGWVAHSPGFPVKLSELACLHAAFLTESRTRCRRMDTRTGNPGQAPPLGLSGRNKCGSLIRYPTQAKRRLEWATHPLFWSGGYGASLSVVSTVFRGVGNSYLAQTTLSFADLDGPDFHRPVEMGFLPQSVYPACLSPTWRSDHASRASRRMARITVILKGVRTPLLTIHQ